MFVSWNEQQSATAQDRAVSKARVKAHAARVAHQRRLDRQSKARHAVQQQQPVGSLVAWRGNSDPFLSQPIDITPRLGQILDFLRTVWIPASLVKLPPPFPPTVRSLFCTQLMLDHLHTDDHRLILSVLLPCASALAVLTDSREVSQQHTKLKLAAISHLRARLNHGPDTGMASTDSPTPASEESGLTNLTTVAGHSLTHVVPDDSILCLTQALFIAAVNERNALEAEAHGNMLQWLMRRKTDVDGYNSLKPDMLCQALGYDIVRAQLTRTFSLFDVEFWVPACQRAYKLPAVDNLEGFRKKILDGFDHSIRNSPLQRVLLGTYQCFRLWTETDDPSTDLHPDQIWNYVTLTNATLQLQATNYSLVVQRVITEPTFDAKLAPRAQAYWRIQACLVFSVLLWQLTNITDLKIGGQSYWPRGAMISSALREHIQSYHSNFVGPDGRYEGQYQHAILFACWTGATWQRKSTLGSAEVADCFFHDQLCMVARQCHLASSAEVKNVVDRFLPTIHMRPQDWKWLDPMLRGSETDTKHPPQQ